VTRYRLAAQRRDGFGRVIAKRTRKASASTRKTSLRLPRGRWTVTVQARNRTGWGTPSRSSVQVSPR
jgi:hypothetical protein